MSTKRTPWFSFRGGAYTGNHPAFFDVNDFAWTQQTEAAFAEVLRASQSFLAAFEEKSDPYFNAALASKKGGWRQGTFYFWGKRNTDLCNRAPELDAFMRSIPGMLSAGLSMLEPHVDIHPHYGDTDAVMRCHIGIKIPAGLPECGITVKDETRAWEKGKWLLFCDAHLHAAWNHTNERRIVLIADVLLPEFADQKRDICSDVRSMLSLQKAEQRLPFIKKLPGKLRGIIRRGFRFIHYLRYRDEY